MKKLLVPLLCLLLVACQDSLLIGNSYTQSELISTISQGKNTLWLGSETGALFSFNVQDERFTPPQWVDSERIYSIVEVEDSLLLVGVRNAGVKLVSLTSDTLQILKDYQIDTGTRFSPYSLHIKRGSKEVDTLLCASSNGLFYAPIPRQELKQIESIQLKPLYPSRGQNSDYKFYALAEEASGTLYAAGNKGLLRIEYIHPAHLSLVSDKAFSHLSSYKEGLYALTEQGMLFDSNDMSDPLFSFTLSPFVCYRDKNNFWGFAENQVEVLHESGNSQIYRLPHLLSIGKNNPRGRNAVVLYQNFFYVATGRTLLSFPKGNHPVDKQHIATTCYDEEKRSVFIVNEQNELYSMVLPSGERRYLKQIHTDGNMNVKGVLGFWNNELYLYTSNAIYRTALTPWSDCKKVLGSTQGKEIQQATLSLSEGILLYAYTDSIFAYDPNNGSTISLTPKADFYTSAIALSPDGSRAFVGTLNDGLFMNADLRTSLTRLDDIPITDVSVRDLICIDDETLCVLTPSYIYLMKKQGGTYGVTKRISSSRAANKLIYDGSHLLTLSINGGIECYNQEGVRENQPGHCYRKDVLFQRNGVLNYGDSLILASDNGLAFCAKGDLETLVWKPLPYPALWKRVLYWKFPVGMVLIVLILTAIVLLIIEMYRARLRKKQLLHIMSERAYEKRLKEIHICFSEYQHELSTLNHQQAFTYVNHLLKTHEQLFANGQTSLEELESANKTTSEWLKLYKRYKRIASKVSMLQKPYEILVEKEAYQNVEAITIMHHTIEQMIQTLHKFVHYNDYNIWQKKTEELEQQFVQFEHKIRRERIILEKYLKDILSPSHEGSSIPLTKALNNAMLNVIDGMKEVKDIEAVANMGNFLRPLPALHSMLAVGQLVEQLALIPQKQRTFFLDNNLSKKDQRYAELFAMRGTFELLAKQFYDQLSDDDMHLLKQTLNISQKSSHRALLFIAMFFMPKDGNRETLYLLHGDMGINNQETTNSRMNEIKRSLTKLHLPDYNNKLSFVAMLICILHKELKIKKSTMPQPGHKL